MLRPRLTEVRETLHVVDWILSVDRVANSVTAQIRRPFPSSPSPLSLPSLHSPSPFPSPSPLPLEVGTRKTR